MAKVKVGAKVWFVDFNSYTVKSGVVKAIKSTGKDSFDDMVTIATEGTKALTPVSAYSLYPTGASAYLALRIQTQNEIDAMMARITYLKQQQAAAMAASLQETLG